MSRPRRRTTRKHRAEILRSGWLAGAFTAAAALLGFPAGERAPAGIGEIGAPVVHSAQATSPASGTLDAPGTLSTGFTVATLPGGNATFSGANCTALPPTCSQFVLTVGDAGGKIVRVRLDWSLVANDFDLQIFKVDPGDPDPTDNDDQAGVGSSGNGTTTFEETTFTPEDNTTYHVVVVHFAAVTPDEVTGTLTLEDPPVVIQPARTGPDGTGIAFSPTGNIPTPAGEAPTGKGTVAAPEAARDGEPSIRADQLGNVYPGGIRGVPAGVDVWRFGPDASCPAFTFHDDEEFPTGGSPADPSDGYVYVGQPDGIFATDGAGSPDAGGGDIELAVNFPATATIADPPNLSMVSLTLANITSAHSEDRGNDWTPANPVSATVPLDDRQWIEAYGENTVYLYYRTLATLTGLVLNKSIDGGQTYAAATNIVNPTGFTPGWIDVDQTPNPDGSVDIYLSGQTGSEAVIFHCTDPTPELPNVPGVTDIRCSQRSVDSQLAHGHIFDVVSVDNAGNVYLAWSNNLDIYYAYSTDKGVTWSGPVQVTDAADPDMPDFNFFPWITAGDDGRVGIVWYGTFGFDTNQDDDSEWKAYYAFTPDARAPTPTLLWTEASDHFIHKGNVSQGGFDPNDPSLNRNLIDFFQVAHDPRDGAALVAFADDHNDFEGHTYYARQIAGPGLLANGEVGPIDCPDLTPLVNPEVLDFLGDATGRSGILPANNPEADILNIDYGSEEDGTLFLTADMAIGNLLAVPAQRHYRIFFAVNTTRGLMDAGNEYFIEVTTENGTPEFWLGVMDRPSDGRYDDQADQIRVEEIGADQRPTVFETGAPGLVRLRVDASRLDYSHTTGGTPADGGSPTPGIGDLVIGLKGQVHTPDPGNQAGSFAVLDQTRGGSFIVLGQDDDGDGDEDEIECTDEEVTQFGGWHEWTTNDPPNQGRFGGSETYCRQVGHRGKKNESTRPYMEFRFPGSSTEVRYDYFLNPRGGVVEVIVDGVSREIIDQFEAGSDQSGHEELTPASSSFPVAPQANQHTLRVVHRTDLDGASRNIAYVDGFVVTGGATGSAASQDGDVTFTNTLAAGEEIDHVIVAGLGTLFLGAVVEPTRTELFDAGALRVEIYDPAGLLVGTSEQPLAPETVVAPTLLPGHYTIRVTNTTDGAVTYRASMLKTQRL